MAFTYYYFETELPEKVIESIENEFLDSDSFQLGSIGSGGPGVINTNIRNSDVKFKPPGHWMAGFIWHYVQLANNANFNYDITELETCQLSKYGVGQFYTWHIDGDIYELPNENMNSQTMRKLSYSLQLSEYDEYEGGNLQLLDPTTQKMLHVQRKRGTLIIFDSRVKHRVTKVTKGERKSLVGWIRGPRWK